MRALIVVAIVMLGSAPVLADNRTEAVLLFDQGQKEMKAGHYDKACNSFERSLAAYQDSGTKANLAMCYEKLGRLASSWLLWRELADLAPTPALRKNAAARATKLEPKIAHYEIKIASATKGMAVTINGKDVELAGVPVPIDAGPVIVRAYASGYQDWSSKLAAVDGETLTIEIPALEPVPAACCEDHDKPPPPPPPPPPPRRSKRKLFGMIALGAGAGAVIAGSVFGLIAHGHYADAEDTCGGSIDACDPGQLAGAQQQVDDARSAGNLSTGLFVVGAAAVAGGIVLYVTAPRTERAIALRPVASASGGGLALSGRF